MKLMEKFLDELRPTYVAREVEQLSPDLFYSEGLLERVDGIGFDDGTLMSYQDCEVPETVHETLSELSKVGLDLFVISNEQGSRAEDLNQIFGKDLGMTVITPSDIAGEDNSSSYLKPNPKMIQCALSEMDVPHDEFLMVGGQLFKDVLSANRADVLSMLLPRRGEMDNWRARMFRKPVEVLVRKTLELPICPKSFPERIRPIGPVHCPHSTRYTHKYRKPKNDK